MTRRLVLALTGASGVVYGLRLLHVWQKLGIEVHLSLSNSARLVLEQELGWHLDLRAVKREPWQSLPEHAADDAFAPLWSAITRRVDLPEGMNSAEPGTVHYHHWEDFFAPIASGSFLTDGMVICPCSGTTLSAVVQAQAGNLIQRAAEVHLKERRPLVLVPRETPVSVLQLENMRRAADAGAVVLPASPGFYHGVTSMGDLVDFVVARICDQVKVPHALCQRWGT